MAAFECYALDLVPNRLRGEFLCAGVLAIGPDGPVVRITLEQSRARALHPDMVSFDPLRWQEELEEVLGELPRDSWTAILGGPEGLVARKVAGTIFANDHASLVGATEDMARSLTSLPKCSVKTPHKAPPQTKLQQQLKAWFRSSKIYSTKASDITQNRVVSNFPISAENDMFADFALRNGVLHVIETVDLRGSERLSRATRNEAGFKAMLLDQVRTDNKESQRVAVFAADDYAVARPAISLVSRYASDVIVIDSERDRDRLAGFVSKALHLPELLSSRI